MNLKFAENNALGFEYDFLQRPEFTGKAGEEPTQSSVRGETYIIPADWNIVKSTNDPSENHQI